jgi:hypothetical protein
MGDFEIHLFGSARISSKTFENNIDAVRAASYHRRHNELCPPKLARVASV